MQSLRYYLNITTGRLPPPLQAVQVTPLMFDRKATEPPEPVLTPVVAVAQSVIALVRNSLGSSLYARILEADTSAVKTSL
jgi:hypothetical protein